VNKPPLPSFSSRLHDERTASLIGTALGVAFATAFATGLVSHFLQHPPGWLAGHLPTRPTWGYRLTQGLHVGSGIAAIPLLFAKLWTVYSKLFEWPPLKSLAHALERLSILVLLAGAMFELVTGLLNAAQWYPWKFPFIQTHYWVAWITVGALVVHIDPQLDQETLQQLLTRTIEHVFRQKLARDEADRPATNVTVPPDVDSGWDL